jgi:hypothetical protein
MQQGQAITLSLYRDWTDKENDMGATNKTELENIPGKSFTAG